MVRVIQKKEIVSKVLFFLLKFNLLLIPFYAIIYFDLSFYPLQVTFANFIATILKLLDHPVRISEFYLFIGRDEFPIDISMDCLGWKSIYSLFALVFATNGKTKDKLRFLIVWIPMLFVINILRVLITLLVGLNFGMQYLEFIHTFFWQEVMIVVLIVIFYIWLKKRKIK
ncbi:MAG: archaeosortase/exosortase family protein [Candidatus Aenigmarchaeota archaeon]|nr:archaeosortase/exosortase family protein [Candidatus Aenigmarchaeota archaeon]